MEEIFKIKSYGWKELAILYSPNVTPNSATRRLTLWVVKNKQLYEALAGTGWTQNNRLLTPEQVRIIVGFIGEP